VYFSRGFAQSFAIVQVGQAANVPVYLESQLVAHTRPDGTALVNNLRAYQDNRISVDPLAVPFDSSMGDMDQTVQPRLLGGVQIDFAVHQVVGITVTVQQADSSPLPAWSAVQVQGLSSSFVVGKRGEVFVEFPAVGTYRLSATPPAGVACSFAVQVRGDGSAPDVARCE
jgi:outer membrane usher protein